MVSIASWAPLEEREAFSNHFEASLVRNSLRKKIHVSHEHVGSHACTCFATDTGGSGLQGESTTSQDP